MTTNDPQATSRRSTNKKILIGTGAVVGLLVLATIFAAFSGGPVEETPEYKSLLADSQAKDAQLESAAADVESANAALEQAEGDLPDREAAAAAKASELDSREQAVVSRESDLDSRERAVGLVEDEVAANTIAGDGTFLVGDDMKPGTYRGADNSEECYWQTSSDPNGSDIIANDIGRAGTRFADVAEGNYFQTSGCSDWVLQ